LIVEGLASFEGMATRPLEQEVYQHFKHEDAKTEGLQAEPSEVLPPRPLEAYRSRFDEVVLWIQARLDNMGSCYAPEVNDVLKHPRHIADYLGRWNPYVTVGHVMEARRRLKQ